MKKFRAFIQETTGITREAEIAGDNYSNAAHDFAINYWMKLPSGEHAARFRSAVGNRNGSTTYAFRRAKAPMNERELAITVWHEPKPETFDAETFDAEAFMIDEALKDLQQFMGRSQTAAIRECLKGEEREFFIVKLVELAALISAMPVSYQQDGVADPVVTLHYFTGACDWYITEKDVDSDGAGQVQAYGRANLGHGGEMGYISIEELLSAGAELDLYFKPRPLSKIPE